MTKDQFIEMLDAEVYSIGQLYGKDSDKYKTALSMLDIVIEKSALSDDGWTREEIKAMNGEC